ncbi:MAG: hypothetical protein IID42_04555 [Planctomycetes bacterium]|nr:hypothetical protein [Planctomycetota bacterium]
MARPTRCTMRIRYHCPNDRCVAIIEYGPLEECDGTITCPRCHQTHPITVTEAIRQDDTVDQCAVCGATEMFIRRDFPQRLGLLIVVVFGLTAIYFFSVSVLKAWCVLGSALLLDLIIYFLVGKVTACYACRAEYRRCQVNSTHDGFDLATSEKY